MRLPRGLRTQGEFGCFAETRSAIYRRGDQPSLMLDTLFPALPAAPGKAEGTQISLAGTGTGAGAKPAADRQARQADRRPRDRAADRCVRRPLGRPDLALAAGQNCFPPGWLTRSAATAGRRWSTGATPRNAASISHAFQLGRLRAATPRTCSTPPLDLSDYSLASLERAYADDTASVEPQGKDRIVLVLKYPTTPSYETRVLIDTARHVVLSIENRDKGKAPRAFGDFVEAAGCWWAREDRDDRRKGQRDHADHADGQSD